MILKHQGETSSQLAPRYKIIKINNVSYRYKAKKKTKTSIVRVQGIEPSRSKLRNTWNEPNHSRWPKYISEMSKSDIKG